MSLSPGNSPGEFEKLCKVCGDEAKGFHFGALSCRACAAFFRRAASPKGYKSCESHLKCSKKDFKKCKKCRLLKCYEVGMSAENFQYCRDLLGAKQIKLSRSVEQFAGRPHFVLLCNPDLIVLRKNIIDCDPLFEKSKNIFEMGSESPLQSTNRLLKLSYGLQKFEEIHSNEVKIVTKFGKDEILSFFERDFLSSSKWFSYLDEFQNLSSVEQNLFMQGAWHTWARLYKLSITSLGRRRGLIDENTVMVSHQKEFAVCDLDEIVVDMGWCANYSNEQMRYFLATSHDSFIYTLMDEFLDLNPNFVELSYMMCELSLQYAGQRFQGKILEFCEKMVQVLADDLHHYYVHQMNITNYAGRLAKMMRINNRLRIDILQTRQRKEIAEIFKVWNVEFSAPDIFRDA